MLALAAALAKIWPGTLETHFIARALTQDWDTNADPNLRFLPATGQAEAVRRMLRDDPPDLVHCAGWGGRPCRTAIGTAHRLGLPVVVDLDTWQDAAKGPKAWAKKFFLPRLLKRVTHFAPAGQRQAAFLKGYGVPQARITPINMTVDVDAIQTYLEKRQDAGLMFRQQHGLPVDKPLLLFLGRFVPEKGLRDLMKAWDIVQQQEPRAHLALVGDGVLRPEIQAHANDKLHLLGRLSGDAVWQAYAAADVFVAPSRWEPWGLTINEAMATSTPIVMTDAFGCIGDLAVHGQTAYIVPAAQPANLAQGILEVLRNPAIQESLRRKADAVISEWTIEAEARRIVQIWTSCL